MTGLDAGAMDRPLTLKTAVKTQHADTNEEVIDWDSADETIWGQWLPGNTSEGYLAQKRLGAYIDGIFRIYYRETLPTPDASRIVFKGRTFDVKGVTEIGREDGLELSVVARGE
jgi:head-tail adaptor